MRCTVGAFVHKINWFSNLYENEDLTKNSLCFCYESVCICMHDLIALILCLIMVPFVILVFVDTDDSSRVSIPNIEEAECGQEFC